MLAALLLAGSLAVGELPKADVVLSPPREVVPTVIDKPNVHPPGDTAIKPDTAPATPPSLGDCLKGCPNPNDPAPFLRTPTQEPLGQCKDGSGCGGAADLRKEADVWRHTFHTAARFSIPRFSQQGEPVEADGVVIYEGMRLTVNAATGVYDLSFTATTPPTPVTLRLQLVFHPPGEPDKTVRLTLPPIDIEPEASRSSRSVGTTVRVSHRGFSELFLNPDKQAVSSDLLAKPPINIQQPFPLPAAFGYQVTKDWTVVRGGTARFGSALTTSDDSGR